MISASILSGLTQASCSDEPEASNHTAACPVRAAQEMPFWPVQLLHAARRATESCVPHGLHTRRSGCTLANLQFKCSAPPCRSQVETSVLQVRDNLPSLVSAKLSNLVKTTNCAFVYKGERYNVVRCTITLAAFYIRHFCSTERYRLSDSHYIETESNGQL